MRLIRHLGRNKGILEKHATKTVRKISRLLRPGLTVLMYHRVTNLPRDPQRLSVTPEKFEAQLMFLKREGRIMSIDQFDKILETGKKFPAKSVLITFDDGYADNFLEAKPILEKLNIQALFFISTGNIGTHKEFWWDNLERTFLGGKTPTKLSTPVENRTYEMPTENDHERTLTYRQFHKILKPLKPEAREITIENLLKWADLPQDGRETHRSMTQEEIKLLSESPVAKIGAHTRNHVMLSSLSPEDQRKEVVDSKNILETITGKPVIYFSYPFGGKDDYTKNSVEICKNLGFTSAFGGFYGIVRSAKNRFELPRIIARNWSVSELQKNID